MFQRLKCSGYAHTDQDGQVMVQVTKMHNHAPSQTRIEMHCIKNVIKQTAKNSVDSPRNIVSTSLVSNDAKCQLPKIVNLEKTAGRSRRAMGVGAPIPHSLADVSIPEHLFFTRTAQQEPFIMHDTGAADPARVMIFSCVTDVSRLCQCDTWIVDGIFRAAPDLWYQIWVIHGKFRGRVVPLIYALLPNKLQSTYVRTLEYILIKIDSVWPGARPMNLVVDYEMAVINGFQHLIPGISVHGCYFHFSQSIWRKIQELGLATRCFMDLQCPGNFEDHQDGEQGEMTGAIVEGLPRTTNSAESWHHAFSSIFSTHHPNPYKLIDGLLREQVRVDFICSRLEAGETVELYSRADYRQANERLLTLIGRYHEMDPGDFLRSCCSYIHLSP